MRPWSLAELALAMGGVVHAPDASVTVDHVALDSREVRSGSLFVAIRGERSDGHDFAQAAIEGGARAVLSERSLEVPHLRVGSVVEALARWAAVHRQAFAGTVIGVTGSYGKTSTKEFLAAALSPLGHVGRTSGNRNTELTIPLFWAELGVDPAPAVVIEMAMRGMGQIAHLASFCRPTIGVVTIIGHAHLEKVGSQEGIARAKGELFQALPAEGTAICLHEDPFRPLLSSLSPAPVLTFGSSEEATLSVTRYRPIDDHRSEVNFRYGGQTAPAVLPALGAHLARNAAAAVLAAIQAGVSFGAAADSVGLAALPAMRMQMVRLNGARLLLDAYNAGPESFRAALETARDLPRSGRFLAVVGEMRELGELSDAAHRELASVLLECGVQEAVFLGPATKVTFLELERLDPDHRKMPGRAFLSEVAQARAFLERVVPGDVVVIKGSRAVQLELALEGLPLEVEE